MKISNSITVILVNNLDTEILHVYTCRKSNHHATNKTSMSFISKVIMICKTTQSKNWYNLITSKIERKSHINLE